MKKHAILLLAVVLVAGIFMSCDLLPCLQDSGTSSTEVSRNITPESYKIAVISMELTDSAGGTTVTVVDATAADPLIINLDETDTLLAGEVRLETVINAAGDDTDYGDTDPLVNGTTYDGFEIVPLYIEMSFPSTFHVPPMADESGYSMMFVSDGDEATYTYRLIFNIEEGSSLWKRDIIVYLEDILNDADPPVAATGYPDGWYWMRRSVEDGGESEFLISAIPDDPLLTGASHPGGPPSDSTAGPDCVKDMFSDPFWEATENYDSTDPGDYLSIWRNPSDHSRVAERDFEIVYSGTDVSLDIDIFETFNFWYESDASKTPVTMASDLDVVDFGPDYGGEEYGDWGFAPFFPIIANE